MKRFLWIGIVLLAATIGFTAYGTARNIRDKMIDLLLPPAVPVVSDSVAERQVEPQRAVSDYQIIVTRDLFQTKTDDSKPTEPMVNLDNLEKTQLNLRLWGTSLTIGLPPAAIIEDMGKKQQGLYRIGDNVQGATLHMVFKDRVVLRLNGRDEVLEMVDPGMAPVASPRGRRASRRPPPAVRPRPAAGAKRQVAISRQQLAEAMQDLPALMRQIRVTPHATAGRADGLNVSHIQPGSLFFQAGLKNGDVIRSINGKPVQSISDAMNVARGMDMGGPMTLEIQRRRRIETIEYNIR